MFTEELGTLELTEPITVASNASTQGAIDVMNQNHVGCVLIMEKDRLCGIFTERDVLTRVVGRNLDLNEVPISEVMTHSPEYLTVDDPVVHALNAMIAGGYRHVPVLSAHRPVGVFGMRDSVRYIVAMHPDAVLNAPPPGMKIAARPEGG